MTTKSPEGNGSRSPYSSPEIEQIDIARRNISHSLRYEAYFRGGSYDLETDIFPETGYIPATTTRDQLSDLRMMAGSSADSKRNDLVAGAVLGIGDFLAKQGIIDPLPPTEEVFTNHG